MGIQTSSAIRLSMTSCVNNKWGTIEELVTEHVKKEKQQKKLNFKMIGRYQQTISEYQK